MSKALTRVKAVLTVGMVSLMLMLVGAPVFADENSVETAVLPGDIGIGGIFKIILNVLVYGLGAAAVLGIVIVGIQYMTARDNEAQMRAAKQRFYNILIGLVAWAAMFAVLNWLIPGGLSLDLDF